MLVARHGCRLEVEDPQGVVHPSGTAACNLGANRRGGSDPPENGPRLRIRVSGGRSRDLSSQEGRAALTGGNPDLRNSPARQTGLSDNTIWNAIQAHSSTPILLMVEVSLSAEPSPSTTSRVRSTGSSI